MPECFSARENTSSIFDPSASLTQTPLCPFLSDAKASRRPSAEYCGFPSFRVDETNRTGTGGGPPASDSVARQMLASHVLRTNASLAPIREIAGAVTSSPSGSSGFAPGAAAILQSTLPRPLLPDGLPLDRTTCRPSAVQVRPQVSPSNQRHQSRFSSRRPIVGQVDHEQIGHDDTGRSDKRDASPVRRDGRIPTCDMPSPIHRSNRGRGRFRATTIAARPG